MLRIYRCTATIVHPAAGEGCNGDEVRSWCDLPGFSVYRVLINVKVGEYRTLQNLTYGNIYNLAKPNIRGYTGQEKPIYTCNIQKEHLQACRCFCMLNGGDVLFTHPESG